jgi:two-component system, OmpR family, response regulator
MRLLVIDDDKLLADYIRLALQEDGHAVDVAHTAAEGRTNALVFSHDAIVLDFNLPDGSGLEVVEAIRGKGRSTPILMLTARDDKEDVIRCLDAGADDYLSKPFVIGELRARVRALVRRGGAVRNEQVTFGDLSLDRLQRRITREARELPLTPKEYSLLEFFLLNTGRVVTRTELLEKVWDMHFDPGSNVVDVHVARLRGKLQRASSQVSISTVRGSGFMLVHLAT